MVHTLIITAADGLAGLWPFPSARTTDAPLPPEQAQEIRSCPHCGETSRQRVVERQRLSITYWCSACAIPHEVERPAVAPPYPPPRKKARS